jgi:hypothetical protein
MAERRLNNSCDVRRYLANLINRVEGGKAEVSKAKTLGYLCSLLLRALETSDLEKRIEELEKKLT